MLDLDLQLKRNELCVVGRAPLHETMDEAGLYVRDTRFLSDFSVRLNGASLHLLDLQSTTPGRAVITRTNPRSDDPDGPEPHTVMVRDDVTLDTALNVDITIHNFGRERVSGSLEIELASDFRDMFDVRGMTPRERATPLQPKVGSNEATLSARSVDGNVVSTTITCSPDVEIDPRLSDTACGVSLRYSLSLAPGAETTLGIRIAPRPVGPALEAPSTEDLGSEFSPHLAITAPSDVFARFLHRCDADLALLQTSFPDGNVPAAGIPWYIAPFGRDSLIVGLQTMHAYPGRIASTLRVLAALQATEEDPWREAQPGKILHEMRYGDMARTGQVPHTPYYGSIDSTPLFVMVFAQHYLWHRDDALFDELAGNVRHALGWIEQYGDLDGDGLIEFSGMQQDQSHISQQGWKDSHDSLHFADGREVEGPIALVEVQGYVYAACAWLAEAARLRGDDAWADELQARADRVREAVERSFWMEEPGYYAQALDGQKQQVDAISSNPGHLLYCGLPSAERGARVAARLAQPDLNSGWGIRTLSSEMATYNPMSYHNGSVWPHDYSLTMDGLRAYGHDTLARELAMALLALGGSADDLRMAELYCGFAPTSDLPGPVAYPVSCIPQAWAAGAGLLALRTLLGLRPDPAERRLLLNPHLPEGWPSLAVSGLSAFGSRLRAAVERDGDGYSVSVVPE